VLVPPSALQLPPSCRPPPPAAFFLVEQLLRRDPSAAGMELALKLLRGTVSLLTTAGQQLPNQQQHKGQQAQQEPSRVADRQAASAELCQLAYSSLANSVVQACVQAPQLATGCVEELLQLATQLARTAEKEDCSTGSSSNGRSGGRWNLAGCLAAAVAAGAYSVHLQACHSGAAGMAESSSADKGHTTHTGPCSVSCGSGGGGSSCGSASAVETGMGSLACSVCLSATGVLVGLRCLERGAAVPAAGSWAAALAVAAQRHGTTMQKHLQQQLLALAWRHPVPGMCGNVLCGRLEGTAAVGAVWGPRGTLCGGCRAAWYCCKECQEVAWAAHREVCKTSQSSLVVS
jgi:hypothetical protein